MGHVIAVVSGKGGTGKTTVSGAVGSALAAQGKKTLCMDADAGLRNLDITLGLESFAPPDFLAAARGEVDVADCLVQHPSVPNLWFLAAPYEPGYRPEDLKAVAALKQKLSEQFDFMLTDAPAGMGDGFEAAVLGAQTALVVVTTDASSYRDAGRIVQRLDGMGVPNVRLIVNRIRPSVLRRWRATVDDAVDSVGARLLGVVPEDKDVILAANLGRPLMLYSDRGATAAFDRIARRLAGQRLPIRKLHYNF